MTVKPKCCVKCKTVFPSCGESLCHRCRVANYQHKNVRYLKALAKTPAIETTPGKRGENFNTGRTFRKEPAKKNTHICKVCRQAYTPISGNTVHCSKACAEVTRQSHYETVACQICGDVFSALKSQHRRNCPNCVHKMKKGFAAKKEDDK